MRDNKICMLLLGDIAYDSRVQKEITTLWNAGFDIDLYCLAGSFDPQPGDNASLGRVKVNPTIKYYSRYFRDELTDAESLLRERFGDRLTIRLYKDRKPNTTSTLMSSATFVVKELWRRVLNGFRRGSREDILRIDDLRQVFRLCGSMIAHGFARNGFIWLRRLRLYDVALSFCYWKQFIEQAGTTGYDFYHAHDLYTLFPAFRLSRKYDGKPIYDAHEIMTAKAKSRNILFWKAMERVLIKRCHSVITTTKMRGEHLHKRYKVDTIVIVKNCPVYSDYPRTKLLHERLKLSHDTKMILYLGGIQEGRGLKNLIRSMHNLDSDAVAVLMGPGKQYRNILNELITLEGLKDRVYFIDPVDPRDVVRFAGSADVGVQLLQNTNFNCYSSYSTKLFQYIMAGIPVICSNLPGMRKIVQENDIGNVVNPEDTNSISSALKAILGDDRLRDHYGRNARAASKKYSWEHEEGRLLSVYGVIRIDGDISEQELSPVR